MSEQGQRDDRKAYRIQVDGRLDRDWSEWFDELDITLERIAGGKPATILTTALLDQAALRGLLCRLWDLNLALISVTPLQGKPISPEEREVR
jgi:hypothetical protein